METARRRRTYTREAKKLRTVGGEWHKTGDHSEMESIRVFLNTSDRLRIQRVHDMSKHHLKVLTTLDG